MQFGREFFYEVRETDGLVHISVQAVHQALQLALCYIEAVFCQNSPQVARQDYIRVGPSEVPKDLSEVEVRPAAQVQAQVLHVSLRQDYVDPETNQVTARVAVEELSQLCLASTVEVGSVRDQSRILLAERKNESVEVLKRQLP